MDTNRPSFELEKKAEYLARLAALAQTVTASLDPRRVFEAVVDGTLQLLSVALARLWVVEPPMGEIVLVARAFFPDRPVDFEGGATRLTQGQGIPGWVIDRRRFRYSPVLTDDPLRARPEWVKREGFVSQLAVPLIRGEQTLGALVVTTRERREFPSEERELLETFAATAALAIENARLHEETKKRLSQTETFLAVGQAVGSTLDLPEIGRRTTREMVRALGADMGGAWFLSPGRDQLLPLAGYHVPRELVETFSRTSLSIDDRFIEEAKRLQGPICASDSQADPRFDHPFARLIPHKSVLVYPMWAKGEIIGGFAIIWVREARRFTSEEMRLVEGIARQAAVAIENARLLEAEREARRRQVAFVEIVKALVAEDDFDRLFSLIGRRVRELIGVDSAVVTLVEGDEIVYRGSYGFEEADLVARRRKISESRIGRAVLNRRPYASFDMTQDPHWRNSALVTRLGYRAVLDVPIILRDEVIGVLGVLHKSPRTFSAEDTDLLLSLAGHAAIALDRTNLLRELRARLQETQTLLTISHTVNSTLDLAETMRRVARETARAIGADTVGAYLADPDGSSLRPIAGYHIPKHLLETFREFPIPLGEHRFLDEAWERQEPIFSSDSPSDPRIDRETFERFPHRSVLFVPMVVKRERVGGFFVIWWEERHPFTLEELRLVEGISRQAAIAIENARLHEGLLDQMAALKRTQAQLVQSTKLAALGELAAQIAHEINNPLTSVLGYASLLLKDSNLPPAIRGDLEVIAKESVRARRIVRDLLDFARRRDPHMEPGDLNGAIRSVLDLLREPMAIGNVRVAEDLASLPPVFMDSDQIKQVFLNLINNAVDAMPEGGTLTITTGVRGSGTGVLGQGSGDQVEVVVADTGVGMSQEQIDQIFDPFYTTKGNERGTGLGLSVSRGIIEGHGGRILVESRPGRGSAFRVILPLRIPHATAKSADVMERNG